MVTDRTAYQGRGQGILRNLKSTEDFTHKSRLSLEARQLILYLVVVLTDQAGSLTTLITKVRAAYGARDGHWAAHRNAKSLHNLFAKTLGKGAERVPRWNRIDDLLAVFLPPDQLPAVRAVTAYLYGQAESSDTPGFAGQPHTPPWAGEPIVTVETIRAYAPPIVPLDRTDRDTASDDGISGDLDLGLVEAHRELAKRTELLTGITKAFQYEHRRANNLEQQVKDLEDRLGKSEKERLEAVKRAALGLVARDHHRAVCDAYDNLEGRYLQTLRYMIPGADDDILRQIMHGQTQGVRPRGIRIGRVPHPRDATGPQVGATKPFSPRHSRSQPAGGEVVSLDYFPARNPDAV
ncbi:hypothetical protein [Amycolatopsis samaneae]|uniref:Uncharacterized protein n=1 Tax=Amycolatopsis samaneae TaxID=664691 RepID=A0ABW5GY31_9PSEU